MCATILYILPDASNISHCDILIIGVWKNPVYLRCGLELRFPDLSASILCVDLIENLMHLRHSAAVGSRDDKAFRLLLVTFLNNVSSRLDLTLDRLSWLSEKSAHCFFYGQLCYADKFV